MGNIRRIKKISEFHRTRGLSAPDHPLISVIDYSKVKILEDYTDSQWVLDFYFISLKKNINGKIKYGQQEYDFDEGVMFFIAPGQVFSIAKEALESPEKSGWMLLIHPDFLWKTTLTKTIKQYGFFDYKVNEALFLSKKEENIMQGIIENIENEYHANIDNFTQNIIISQLETLLNYADRLYQRQFITRQISSHQILERLEGLLKECFEKEKLAEHGIPTVQFISEKLSISPSYLSNLMKVLTGQSTQQHIHNKIVELAKEKLSTTTLSINEIAYELGFDYPQYFSKLFKKNTDLTPLEFRKLFN